MEKFQHELFDQIKQWNNRRNELDDSIDSIYELIDRGEMNNKIELLQKVKILNTERDELDDLIDSAYEQIDNLYNQVM